MREFSDQEVVAKSNFLMHYTPLNTFGPTYNKATKNDRLQVLY